ncbi:MAG: GFA family protein [Alphaproteobacteria bacterium]
MRLAGGCHCGGVRFAYEGDPLWVGHCHCRDCQLTTGAPMTSWFIAPAAEVEIVGERRTYRSSDHATREFCPTCGCLLFFRTDKRPTHLDIVAACLDDPSAVAPSANIYVRSRIGFMDGFDPHLPSFEGNLPD